MRGELIMVVCREPKSARNWAFLKFGVPGLIELVASL
ncbi:hypothetical protein X474_26445 [Dethiosulfatarculus sandiegensis]|uniref:Uncharacterized protein n=1 Tax=Dethiosulfatarculus sandiegensis TaxID=1429043 RepID=A0A0D2IY50_9BACT|nr:hypothetical protein X474_26445 [Dethiosulfatarculus sandiegensis]